MAIGMTGSTRVGSLGRLTGRAPVWCVVTGRGPAFTVVVGCYSVRTWELV